jgi:hypothetical protein
MLSFTPCLPRCISDPLPLFRRRSTFSSKILSTEARRHFWIRISSHPYLITSLPPFFGSLFSIACALFRLPYPATPLFATLTKTPGVYTNNSHSGTRPLCLHLVSTRWAQRNRPFSLSSTFQPSNLPTCQHFWAYLFSFHTLANSFALTKNSTPLFSCNSKLFCKNTRGGGVHRAD